MNTLFEVKKQLAFENTPEYLESFKSSFVKILGLALLRGYGDIPNKNINIRELTSINKRFGMEIDYFIRFTVFLLETKIVTEKDLSIEGVERINGIDLPEEFIVSVLNFAYPLSVKQLFESVAKPTERKSVKKKDVETLKVVLTSFLGSLLKDLDSVPDHVTVDELIKEPQILKVFQKQFKVATLLLQNTAKKEFEINSEMVKKTKIDDFLYQNIMFDIGGLSKKELVVLSDELSPSFISQNPTGI